MIAIGIGNGRRRYGWVGLCESGTRIVGWGVKEKGGEGRGGKRGEEQGRSRV